MAVAPSFIIILLFSLISCEVNLSNHLIYFEGDHFIAFALILFFIFILHDRDSFLFSSLMAHPNQHMSRGVQSASTKVATALLMVRRV